MAAATAVPSDQSESEQQQHKNKHNKKKHNKDDDDYLSEDEEDSTAGEAASGEDDDDDVVDFDAEISDEVDEEEADSNVKQFIDDEAGEPTESDSMMADETNLEYDQDLDDDHVFQLSEAASQLNKTLPKRKRTKITDGNLPKRPQFQISDNEYEYELKDSGGITQDVLKQSRMPSVKDSHLWILRCKPGDEFHVSSLLMNKFIASKTSGQDLGIDSVVYRQNLPGYIYIESTNQGDVKKAIEGISSLRSNLMRDLITVNIKEMPSVLRIIKGSSMELKEDDYVRFRRGVLKDDLAKVVFVDLSANRVQLKFVPRVSDYSTSKNKKVRPAQKLFDKSSAVTNELYEDEDGYLLYQGQQYTQDGFMIKTFPISSIISTGIEPSLSEIKRFEGEENLSSSSFLLKMKQKKFNIGDRVCVVSGDLENLQGKIVTINESTIAVLPSHNELNTPIDFAPSELVKVFDQGDHVRVIAGNHINETGHIINISDTFVTILSDMSFQELKVRIDDLQLSKEKSSGVDQSGQYQYGDLILLDEQNVGMIVQIEKECFKILNCQGKLMTISRGEIIKKRNKPNAITLDADHNPVSIKMQIKVVSGPLSGHEGQVSSIFRHFVFAKSNSYPENGGIFVTRANNIKIFTSNIEYGVINNYASNTVLRSPQRNGQSPSHGKTPARNSAGQIITSRRHPLVGRSVRITKGPYKAYSGIVKATTDTTARIELTTEYKTINVDLSRIVATEPTAEETANPSVSTYWNTPYGQSGSATLPVQTPRGAFMTPMHDGSKTPRIGSQTPRAGNQTPSHMTPHQNQPPSEESFSVPQSAALSSTSLGLGSINPSSEAPSSVAMSSVQYVHSVDSSSLPVTSNLISPTVPNSPSITDSSFNYLSSVPSSNMDTPTTPFVGGNEMPSFLVNLDWISVGLIVMIKDSYSDSSLHGKQVEVRGINGSQISVYVKELEHTTTLNGNYLVPVMPERQGYAKILHGDEVDKVGSVVSIDNKEIIVKIKSDIHLVQAFNLCKCIAPQSSADQD